MRKYKIVCDSGCDFRTWDINSEAVGYEQVPLSISIGDESFLDDGKQELTVMQEMLDRIKGKTGSACPSPGDWASAMAGAENVLVITISHAVSGSYNSALIGRDIALEENPDANIHVVDSISGSGKISLMVQDAIAAFEEGKSFEEVLEIVEKTRTTSDVLFLIQNVKNTVTNGRVPMAIGLILMKMKMKALATVNELGTLSVIQKARHSAQILKKTMDSMLAKGYTGGRVVICYYLQNDVALYFKSLIHEKFPNAHIQIMPTSALCGYYASMDGLTIGFDVDEFDPKCN